MIKRGLLGLLALLLLLTVVLVVNTLRQGSRQVTPPAWQPMVVDKASVAESLAIAVRAKTVSGLLDPTGTAAEFAALHAPEDLPRLHGTDERISIDQLADMVRFYHRLLSQAAK